MRILIAGEDYSWSSETGFVREFRRTGCEVLLWNNKKPRFLFGYRNWWRMGALAHSAYDILSSGLFLRAALRWRPDVLFLPKAENLHSRAVLWAKRRTGAKLVAWYPDHPFKADMTSMNILRNLPHTDIFYIWGRFLVESLQAAGAPDVRYLPFAFDPSTHPTDGQISFHDHRKFSCDISFVGAWDRERENDLAPLAKWNLAIWGPGWDSSLAPSSPLRTKLRGAALYNEELVKCYRCSKIVFNHLRRHNGSAHNMRSMEIAGIGGGVQLVRRTPELSMELFRENQHLVCFETEAEMENQIWTLLAQPQRCRELSQSAQEHVRRKHLLSQRITALLADIRQLPRP